MMARPVPAAYADCIDRRCPHCGAAPREWCINPATGREAAIPCLARSVEHE